MTTVKTSQSFRLPDRPERETDDSISSRQMTDTSIIEPLRDYLSNRETTLITGDRHLCRVGTPRLAGTRRPDLLIAFNADLEAHRNSKGYITDEQGKPPDFAMEIASDRTGREDSGKKPRDYAGFDIPEYWHFNETPTGRWHGAPLGGGYESISIEHLHGNILQSYSRALDLYLRWAQGQLLWHDPATGRHLPAFNEERERADQEQGARPVTQQPADQERQVRLADQEQDNQQRETHLSAEAHASELLAELENLRNR